MKKALFSIFVLFAISVGLFAQQPVVAVAPFDAISGISAADANMITRVFTIRLGNTQRVAFVDRNIVEQVLQEHRFQAGDWSNAQKTAELGRALNADWIVRGELESFGTNILVTVQFYDIQTFRFMGGADILLTNAAEAMEKMDPLVNKLVDTITTVRRPYRIGDSGPGGGIIFFAEGSQYKEYSTDFFGFHYYRDAMNVARRCRGGGFADWYLPTVGELELIQQNINRNVLARFPQDDYWTSTPHSSSDWAWYWSFKDRRAYNIGPLLVSGRFDKQCYVVPVRAFSQ